MVSKMLGYKVFGSLVDRYGSKAILNILIPPGSTRASSHLSLFGGRTPLATTCDITTATSIDSERKSRRSSGGWRVAGTQHATYPRR